MTGLTIAAGDTFVVDAGDQYWADPIEVGGQLTVGGTVTLDAAAALAGAGVGDGVGSAPLAGEYAIDASGVGERRIDAGDTRLVASGETDRAGRYVIGGELEAAGQVSLTVGGTGQGIGTATLDYDAATAAAGVGEGFGAAALNGDARVVAAGVGTGTGTATVDVERALGGAGVGEGFGSADPTFVEPLIRRDDVGIVYDEDEEIELNTDG
jgi:hypothetical protein